MNTGPDHKLVGPHSIYLPSNVLMLKVMQKIQRNCLIRMIAPSWSGLPWF